MFNKNPNLYFYFFAIKYHQEQNALMKRSEIAELKLIVADAAVVIVIDSQTKKHKITIQHSILTMNPICFD